MPQNDIMCFISVVSAIYYGKKPGGRPRETIVKLGGAALSVAPCPESETRVSSIENVDIVA